MSLPTVARPIALVLMVFGTPGFAQVVEGSFEGGIAGGAVPAPWGAAGTAVVFPAFGCTTDPSLGFPSDGAQWVRIASGGGAATPGAFTNANNVSQTFTTGAAGTLLHLDVAFSTGEGPGSFFNDFLAVTVSNGTVTPTLLLLETATA